MSKDPYIQSLWRAAVMEDAAVLRLTKEIEEHRRRSEAFAVMAERATAQEELFEEYGRTVVFDPNTGRTATFTGTGADMDRAVAEVSMP